MSPLSSITGGKQDVTKIKLPIRSITTFKYRTSCMFFNKINLNINLELMTH